MTWIALKDSFTSSFNPAGLTSGSKHGNLNTLLTTGTLLFEYRHDPEQVASEIARFEIDAPWQECFSLNMERNGDIALHWQQASETRKLQLATGFDKIRETLTISLIWDAPARRGLVSVTCHDTGRLLQKRFDSPFPLSVATAESLFRRSALKLGKGTRFAALADTAEPCGPIATIGVTGVIETPQGHTRIPDLTPGDPVITATGEIATVRWVGRQVLPARGIFAPLMMRAPYRDLREDLLIAPTQTLRLKGSRIEYVFGREEVRAEARHLIDGKSIVRANKRLLVEYAQIILDRPALLQVSGTDLEPLDPHRVIAGGPHAHLNSVIAALPQALFPAPLPEHERALRQYEAPAVTY